MIRKNNYMKRGGNAATYSVVNVTVCKEIYGLITKGFKDAVNAKHYKRRISSCLNLLNFSTN